MDISLLADFPNEADKVAKWYFDEWGRNDPTASVEGIRNKILLGANEDKLPLMYLGHLNGELIGAGEIKSRHVDEYPHYHDWLDGIYVAANHRGKGFSTLLIDYAKQKALELGLQTLHLRCTAENVKLYEARGYYVVKAEGGKFIMEQVFNTL